MISLAYQAELDFNNTKGLLFKMTFAGVYGVKTVGDLLNLAPFERGVNDNGIADPNLAYNRIIVYPPGTQPAIVSENLGGYYLQPKPPAVPTLQNIGITVWAPDGTGELASGAAYPAVMLAGNALMLIIAGLQ